MAVAGALRIARDFDRDSAAEALTFERLFILVHGFSVRSSRIAILAHAVSRHSAASHAMRRFSSKAVAI
jgi:hypothetical protein